MPDDDNSSAHDSTLLITRPLHSKVFFTLTCTSLSFTIYSLYRIFRSTQLAQPLQSVRWQRLRMIGQAGVIAGLTGPLVWEGLGFDTWSLRAGKRDGSGLLDYSLGLFGRTTKQLS